MEFLFSLVVLFVSQQSVDVKDYHHRFDGNSIERMKRTFPLVYKASEKTGTPPLYLLGTIYNESNAKPFVTGDGGKSYGMGQIQCRVWKNWLRKKKGMEIETCRELLDPKKNLIGVGHILSMLQEKGGSWGNALEAYHTGKFIPGNGDRAYKERTKYFGETFLPHYERHVEYYEKIEEWKERIGDFTEKVRYAYLKRKNPSLACWPDIEKEEKVSSLLNF